MTSSGTRDLSLHEWQSEAVEAWLGKGGKGIVEAATGSGKTRVALAAIATAMGTWGDDLRVAIVVPTRVLLHQWWSELTTTLGVPTHYVGGMGDGMEPDASDRFVICVINSARTKLNPLLTRWRSSDRVTMLIVDECHRAGSAFNSQIFEAPYDYSLGISATPERESDSATNEILVPALGQICYRYTRSNAEFDGVIAPVDMVEIVVSLTPTERSEYSSLTEDIEDLKGRLLVEFPELRRRQSELIKAVGDLKRRLLAQGRASDLIDMWTAKIMKRRRLLNKASKRREALVELLDALNEEDQAFLFHETIDTAQATAEHLENQGRSVATYHSQLEDDEREAVIEKFRSGHIRWISCVRALDEGVDVPAAIVAVIVSGGYSRRQLIQRLGRVSRKHEGRRALAFRLVAEEEMGRAPRLGKYVSLQWPSQREIILNQMSLPEYIRRNGKYADEDWDEPEDLEPESWAKYRDTESRLVIPVANRVLKQHWRRFTDGLPVNGPTHAIQRASRDVSEAKVRLSQVRRLLDSEGLPDKWLEKLSTTEGELTNVFSSGAVSDDDLRTFHAARTRSRREVAWAETDLKRHLAEKRAKDELRHQHLRKSLAKHMPRLTESQTAGTPIDIYIRDVEGDIVLVTVRGTAIESELPIPNNGPPRRNQVAKAIVTEVDPNHVMIRMRWGDELPLPADR